MSSRILIATLATLIGLTPFIFQSTASATPRTIEVQGHRGARARLPENTLPAFAYALRLGVDVLEMDLGITKDGHLVVNHDHSVNPDICQYEDGRPLKKAIEIHSLTLDEIKKFDCGSKRHKDYPNQNPVPGAKIPTLDEVFMLAYAARSSSGKPVEFNVETKYTKILFWENPVRASVFAKLVVDKIKQYGLLDRVVIQSFDNQPLREARKIDPRVRISALSKNPVENLAKTAKNLKANFISPQYNQITAKEVAAIHKAGARVIPWTPNDEKAWQALIDMKVDGIITDDPEALIRYLESHSR
jgi:glycerophosphoryl diester phosphodiesterase